MSKENNVIGIESKWMVYNSENKPDLEDHAETVFDFINEPKHDLIIYALNNLINTYGEDLVKNQCKYVFKLVNSKRKLKKVG